MPAMKLSCLFQQAYNDLCISAVLIVALLTTEHITTQGPS